MLSRTLGQGRPEPKPASGVTAYPRATSSLKEGVELRPHQEEAVRKALRQNGNLILSHPVGSGKTVTALAAFDRLRQNGMANRALIVTPASLRKNFTDEGVHKFTTDRAAVFGNADEVARGQGRSVDDPDHGARYHVVSYDLFRTNPEKYIKAAGADTVIYDELHKVKNVGITGKALRDARKFHRNFIGLTGSIVSNTPADLVPLVDAMTDGQHHLGTKENFERRFVSEDGKLQNALAMRLLLNPYVHHVDASTGTGTAPRKTVETVKVDMTPEQRELYQYVIGKMDPVTALKFRFGTSKLKTNDVNNIFNKMTQARQVANAIHTVNKSVSLSESAQRSPKIKRVLDDVEQHLRETPDGQVIIYSNMIQGGADVLSQGLRDRGIEHGLFLGKGQPGSTEASRTQAVDDYKARRKRVIILSAAGGEGLNLGDTTFVANVDGHFNPEKIYQAEARGVRAGGQAHRPEADRHVLIRRYVTRIPLSKTQVLKDTIDLVSPNAMMERLLEGQPLLYNPLKRERSPDEWAYEVAENKDERNKQLRSNLDKSAGVPGCDSVEDLADLLEEGLAARAELGKTAAVKAPSAREWRSAVQRLPMQPHRLIKSDRSVMDSYMKEFAPHLEEVEDPASLVVPEAHREREQEYVNALRAYYREAAKPRASMSIASKAKDDSERVREVLKRTAMTGLVGGGLLGGTTLAQYILSGKKPAEAAVLAGATGLATGGLLGGSVLWDGLRNPVFTTPSPRARRAAGLSDAQLVQLLRGLEVQQEEKKMHHIAVGSNARATKVADIVEVPHSHHPVVVGPPQAKRAEHPFTGFIDFQGLKVDVENKKGEYRSGRDKDGHEWKVLMHNHYGEIRDTEGVDGDNLDVYVGPNHDASLVVVVRQHKPRPNGSPGPYDEDKVLVGFDSEEEAIGAYKKQYDRPGFYKDGDYLSMPIGRFWRWVHDRKNFGKKVASGAVLEPTADRRVAHPEMRTDRTVAHTGRAKLAGLLNAPSTLRRAADTTCGESATKEGSVHCGVRNANLSGNLLDGEPGVPQRESLFEAPEARASVFSPVFRDRHHDKVADVVVEPILVAMVDDLVGAKVSSEMTLHDDSVLEPLTPVHVDQTVPGFSSKLANMWHEPEHSLRLVGQPVKIGAVGLNRLRTIAGEARPLFHMVAPANQERFLAGNARVMSPAESALRRAATEVEGTAGRARAHMNAEQVAGTLRTRGIDLSNGGQIDVVERLREFVPSSRADVLAGASEDSHIGKMMRAELIHGLRSAGAGKNATEVSFTHTAPDRSYGNVGLMSGKRHVTGELASNPDGLHHELQALTAPVRNTDGVLTHMQLPAATGTRVYDPRSVTREQATRLKEEGAVALNGRLSRRLKYIAKTAPVPPHADLGVAISDSAWNTKSPSLHAKVEHYLHNKLGSTDKVMLGFDSVEDAVAAYKKQYDRSGFYKEGDYLAMPIGRFWRWVHDERKQGQKVASEPIPLGAAAAGLLGGFYPGKHLAGHTAAAVAPHGYKTRADDVARKAAIVTGPAAGILSLALARKYGLTGRALAAHLDHLPAGLIGAPADERAVMQYVVPALVGGLGTVAGGIGTGVSVGGAARLRDLVSNDAAKTAASSPEQQQSQELPVLTGLVSGGVGALALKKSERFVTGRDTLYHGGPAGIRDFVRKSGLQTRAQRGMEGGITSAFTPPEVNDASKDLVFATTNKGTAKSYAAQHAAAQAVLQDHPHMSLEDALRTARTDSKYLHYISGMKGVQSDAIAHMRVPLWKLRKENRLMKNPEIDPLTEQLRKHVHVAFPEGPARDFFDRHAGVVPDAMVGELGGNYTIRGGLGTEYVPGSSGFKRLGLQELGEYVSTHPGRFGAGALLASAGASGVGYGGYKLLKALKAVRSQSRGAESIPDKTASVLHDAVNWMFTSPEAIGFMGGVAKAHLASRYAGMLPGVSRAVAPLAEGVAHAGLQAGIRGEAGLHPVTKFVASAIQPDAVTHYEKALQIGQGLRSHGVTEMPTAEQIHSVASRLQGLGVPLPGSLTEHAERVVDATRPLNRVARALTAPVELPRLQVPFNTSMKTASLVRIPPVKPEVLGYELAPWAKKGLLGLAGAAGITGAGALLHHDLKEERRTGLPSVRARALAAGAAGLTLGAATGLGLHHMHGRGVEKMVGLVANQAHLLKKVSDEMRAQGKTSEQIKDFVSRNPGLKAALDNVKVVAEQHAMHKRITPVHMALGTGGAGGMGLGSIGAAEGHKHKKRVVAIADALRDDGEKRAWLGPSAAQEPDPSVLHSHLIGEDKIKRAVRRYGEAKAEEQPTSHLKALLGGAAVGGGLGLLRFAPEILETVQHGKPSSGATLALAAGGAGALVGAGTGELLRYGDKKQIEGWQEALSSDQPSALDYKVRKDLASMRKRTASTAPRSGILGTVGRWRHARDVARAEKYNDTRDKVADHQVLPDENTVATALRPVLVDLLALYQLYYFAHWTSKHTSFYGDHQLFERLFHDAQKEFDGVAERVVGIAGESSLDGVFPAAAMRQAQWTESAPDNVGRALHAELDLQSDLLDAYRLLDSNAGLTLGLDDLLMQLASAHESNTYLLRQRARPQDTGQRAVTESPQ